jgi:hypothetical protein
MYLSETYAECLPMFITMHMLVIFLAMEQAWQMDA